MRGLDVGLHPCTRVTQHPNRGNGASKCCHVWVPAGHVMGFATWKAVLSETGRCPFTKAVLRPDMLTVLTANNIEKHRARIVAIS